MESLTELQNPLLDKTSRHLVQDGYQGYQCDYPGHPYQDNIIGYLYTGTNGKTKTQQFLDATSLHLAVEAFCRPGFLLYRDDVSLQSKDSRSGSSETTFTEGKEAEGKEAEGKEAATEELQEKTDVKIQTVSHDVEDDEGHGDYEVRVQTGQPSLTLNKMFLFTAQYNFFEKISAVTHKTKTILFSLVITGNVRWIIRATGLSKLYSFEGDFSGMSSY